MNTPHHAAGCEESHWQKKVSSDDISLLVSAHLKRVISEEEGSLLGKVIAYRATILEPHFHNEKHLLCCYILTSKCSGDDCSVESKHMGTAVQMIWENLWEELGGKEEFGWSLSLASTKNLTILANWLRWEWKALQNQSGWIVKWKEN